MIIQAEGALKQHFKQKVAKKEAVVKRDEVKLGARLVTLLVTPSPYWWAYAWCCKGLCDVRMGSGPYRRFALWISSLGMCLLLWLCNAVMLQHLNALFLYRQFSKRVVPRDPRLQALHKEKLYNVLCSTM